MNYLDICNISDIEIKGDSCFGSFIPKAYCNWSKFGALPLFLEGVNQFCVKAINKFFKSNVVGNSRIVPCQFKNYSFYKELTYEAYFVKAAFQKNSDMYVATFEVFEDSDFACQGLSASGQMYLFKMLVDDKK